MLLGSLSLGLASMSDLAVATLLLTGCTSEVDASSLSTPGAEVTVAAGDTNGGFGGSGATSTSAGATPDAGSTTASVDTGTTGGSVATTTTGGADTSTTGFASTTTGGTDTSTTGSFTSTTTGGADTSTTGSFASTTTGGIDTSTTGSADTNTTGSAQTIAFAAVAEIVDRTCGASVCHGSRERPTLVDNAALYGTLLSTTVRQCGSSALVSPGDTAGSSLLMLVNHQCGNFAMPEGCDTAPCISPDDVAVLTAWIEEGALGN